MVRSRSYASSVSRASRGWKRYAYAREPLRPTRPRSWCIWPSPSRSARSTTKRVDGRHVDAALDDGRAHQHVVAALPEVDDDLLERALVHLPVGDGDPCLRHQLAQPLGALRDCLDAVVHPEDLALAQQFASHRLDGNALVVLADEGQDRLAVGGRRLQQREVADADEAHLERARDRRGAERQDVDVDLQLLHRLLGLHAESLLLVDDQQAEVLERDAVLQQPVGADDAVDLAGLASPSITRLASLLVRKRLSVSTRIG